MTGRTGEPVDPGSRPATLRGWTTIVGVFAVALVVVVALPLERGARATPAVGLLLTVGVVVAAGTSAAMYWVLTRDMRLPQAVGVYAAVFAAFVALVKVVLGPAGLYEGNIRAALTSYAPVSDGVGAVLSASVLFVAYGLVLLALLWVTRVRHDVTSDRGARRSRRPTGAVVVGLVVSAVVAAATLGTVAVVAAIVGLSAAGEYASFVFGSSAGLLVVLSLAVATVAAQRALDGAARARAVGTAAVLSSAFLVCLAFLALYHVLWVVWVLALTSVWPLRTVTPK